MEPPKNGNKLLLLGGTGAMGAHLARLTAEAGIEVHVTSRSKQGIHDSVHYIKGNAKDPHFTDTLFATPWEAIIDFMVYSSSEFTERLPSLLSATDQYLLLSSARVYADSPEPITEDSPRLLDVCQDQAFLKTDEYALAKARQENALLHSGKHNWSIIRPYITYSDQRLQLGVLEKEAWLYRALHGRTIVFPKDIIDHVTTMTRGLDVAKGILSLIGKPSALGQIFHITYPGSHSWREILGLYAHVLKRHLNHSPKILLLEMEDFLKCHGAGYQLKYDRLFNRRFNNKKIGTYLDVADFADLEDGLRADVESFLRNPRFLSIPWRLEAHKDRLTKEHSCLFRIPGKRNKIEYAQSRYLHSFSL